MERTRFMVEADGLGELELGEVLRRRGVHREQLDAWRAAAKALAETAALLVLQEHFSCCSPRGRRRREGLLVRRVSPLARSPSMSSLVRWRLRDPVNSGVAAPCRC